MKDMGRFYFYSLVVHGALALLFLFLRYIPEPSSHKIEFIEFGYLDETSKTEQFSALTAGYRNRSKQDAVGAKTNLVPDKINLPRVVSNLDEELILPSEEDVAYNRIDLDEKTGQMSEDKALDPEVITSEKGEAKEDILLPDLDDYMSSLQSRLSEMGKGDDSYLLEGEILSRNIESKVIPDYPQGVIKNATVKIEFQVQPDGRVTNLVIVKKDDPIFEQICLDSLKQWRFSRINREVVQSGFITFIFRLK